MSKLRLGDIDWNAAVAATGAFGGRGPGLSYGLSAQVLSLSALYTRDYPAASARLQKAERMEPLNPLHALRRALLLARFGDVPRAAKALEGLKQMLPDSPLVDYVRGLLALRGGRPEQARAIANTLATAFPNFAYGKFLRADAQIVLASKLSAVERQLAALPHEPQYESLWADLLAKVALLHPEGGPEQAEKHLRKKVRAGSQAEAAVRRALGWARASAEELESHLERERPGSRAEALVLSCLFGRLERLGDSARAAEFVKALRRRHPERASLKRLQSAFVARLAVDRSGSGEYEQALRLVERCLREQPHDQLYHQNRAALFTLLAEPGPYFEAWSALNRHQYRLMLLGAADSFTVEQAARGHRLFAQQAQGAAGAAGAASDGQRGVFRRVPAPFGSELKPVAVDRDEIAADPELLRQWIHHSRAELVFRHLLLGEDPRRCLLNPRDRDESFARAESLASCAESLGTLVPEEGALLARLLSRRWRDAAARTRTRYAAAAEDEDDDEVAQLRLQHLELLGGLALFCIQWQPGPRQLATAEELLAFVRAEGAFFDDRFLLRVQQKKEAEPPYPVLVLADRVRRVAEAEKGAGLLPEQRAAVIDGLMADLLLRMAGAAYEGAAGAPKEQVDRAMSYVDRARACNPADASVELTAARFLVVGDFHDEAAASLKRFHKLASPDEHEELADAEKLEKVLKERREKAPNEGRRRPGAVEEPLPKEGEDRIAELERELDKAPGSWRLYEEMVQELEKAGRFGEAVDWADRAVAHCLSRALQMNARALAIEARALNTLAAEHPQAARLYPLGAHHPARQALDSIAASEELDYTLLYLLGRCELAAGSPDRAREAFGKAAARCERLLHRAVLRHLTDDIDNAYLAVARASVNSALQEGSVEEAVREAAAVFARLQEPAAWLVDFARVFYSAALARIGNAQGPLPVPRVACKAPWQERLNVILSAEDEVGRALAVAELARESHPPSGRQAQALCERIGALRQQLAVTEALNAAGRLLTERRFEEVLAMLGRPEQPFADEPRFTRLRVLALLGLGRFDEADRLMAEAEAGPTLRDFVAGYPSLVFRQRLAAGHRFLQDADADAAEAVLEGAAPTTRKEEADLAYCLAFALAMRSRQLRRQRREEEARPLVLRALDLLEPHLSARDEGERTHVVELYNRLEKESEAYGRV